MGERSERYVLESLFVPLSRAGGSKDDLRKLILHFTAPGGNAGRARDQLNPCRVVGACMASNSSGPKNGANS
jgi:hypothetical protein